MYTNGQEEIPSGVAVCQKDLGTVEEGVQMLQHTVIVHADQHSPATTGTARGYDSGYHKSLVITVMICM